MLRIAMLSLVLPIGPLPSPMSGCNDPGRVRYDPRTFLGYACADDCGRHKAGYAWAELHRATNPASCIGLGTAEAEGCVAHVEAPGRAESAGFRWALENEISARCECGGAGMRFRIGCERATEMPQEPAQ
jgi:hypothetical protein